MFKNFAEDGQAFVQKNFPERQIYLRSGGEVSYFVLSTRIQVAAVSAVAFMSAWCVITMANLLLGSNPFASPAQKIKLKEAEYERLLQDVEAKYKNAQVQLEQQQKSFELAAKTFQDKHAAIAQFSSATITSPSTIAIGSDEYAAGKIVVAATVRDAEPRKSRKDFQKFAELDVDHSLDLPLQHLNDSQNEILRSAEDETLDNIDYMRSVIEATDMDVDTLLSLGGLGAGGPLLDIDLSPTADAAETRIHNVKARAIEAKALSNVMNSMPLGHPVNADFYRSSSFGIRKDPFTGRPAMHEAVDFVSYRNAPIVATADGVVTFVGRKGSYGRLVEIDHGHGFVTRYAHLEKTFVKRGQEVKRGDELGGMGSTGRSTSTHLHYEVRFQDRVYNPDTFLKAGQYVQQN